MITHISFLATFAMEMGGSARTITLSHGMTAMAAIVEGLESLVSVTPYLRKSLN